MKIFIFFLLIALPYLCFSQDPGFKLFLIGDTGEDTTIQPTLQSFLDTIKRYPNSAAVFLGDNCYKDGGLLGKLGGFDPTDSLSVNRLRVQLKGLNDSHYQGSVYFIPGNHDWFNKTNMKNGKVKLKTEESFIENNLRGNSFIKNSSSTFLPKNGNPVTAVDLNNGKLKLIFLDTHWMVIQKNKDERNAVYAQMDSILQNAKSRNENIVVATHHPIYTVGKHSKKVWFPCKIAKCQNIYYRTYQEMRNNLVGMFDKLNYPVIYASGHDHLLQNFKEGSATYIVSGAGSKTSLFNKKHEVNPKPKSDIPKDRMHKSTEGFYEVDYVGGKTIIKMLYMDQGLKSLELK